MLDHTKHLFVVLSGELTACCVGPHQAAQSTLNNLNNGIFKLKVKPKERGQHLMQVMYNDEHVPGE